MTTTAPDHWTTRTMEKALSSLAIYFCALAVSLNVYAWVHAWSTDTPRDSVGLLAAFLIGLNPLTVPLMMGVCALAMHLSYRKVWLIAAVIGCLQIALPALFSLNG